MQTFLFHIAYSPETFEGIAPGFDLLDNRANERPDWFEYWPIRSSLAHTLDAMGEADFLGYFSPRFPEKTGLGANKLREFVVHHGASHDVLLFSPQPDISAFFANVFLAEEFFNPGFMAAAQEALRAIGLGTQLSDLVTDSRNTVFSNYFLARRGFWQAWFAICEKIFALAESEIGGESMFFGAEPGAGEANRKERAPRSLLTRVTAYGGGAQIKIFLIERIATFMLASSHPHPWRAKAYEPFKLAWSAHFTHSQQEAIVCDALKIAYQATGFEAFATKYLALQSEVLGRVLEQSQKPHST